MLKCLDRYKDEEPLIEEINYLVAQQVLPAYPLIFNVPTSLVIEPDGAEQCRPDITQHHR